MRILVLAAPLALWGLAGCSSGPQSYATMTSSGVGFGDYQRFLRERTAEPARSRSGVPYSVLPETRQQPILPPASMPASAPTTLDIVPVRERPAPPVQAASATAPIATQTLAPVTQAAGSAPASAPPTEPTVRDQQVYHAGESRRHAQPVEPGNDVE